MNPKVSSIALVHHWLVGMRGGEKVLEQFGELFSHAPIFTLVADEKNISSSLRAHEIKASFLQAIPQRERYYRHMLPLYPAALRAMKLPKETSLILSSDASIVKGIRIPDSATHVCYCHSPARYLWEMEETYLKQTAHLGAIGKWVFRNIVPYARQFDYEAAQKVSHFIANSKFVQQRIQKYYGRESEVIYPPVDVEKFKWGKKSEDFYLIVSQLVSYKRVDIAVEAFNRLGKKLVIIGDGAEKERLMQMAKPNVQFLGKQPDTSVIDHFERCRAFIYPQVEDFGITAVEAQAAGKPVIALSQGGALETLLDGKTGIFFHEQNAEALIGAIQVFENKINEFNSLACRQNAEKFSTARFREEIKHFFQKKELSLGW
ncbi:MAG: glycosyltransferase [Verrucomicrobiota bacterium]